MEGKLFSMGLISSLILLISLSCSLAEENVTEGVGVGGVTTFSSVGDGGSSGGLSSTSASTIRGRSLFQGENELEGKGDRRHPKFGFTVPFPNIPGMGGEFNMNTTPGPSADGTNGGTGDLTNSASIGTTAVLIKGGILSGLPALKAAILPPIFLGALILFLIAGAGFFTCSVVNCGRFFGDIAVGGPGHGTGFGGLPNFSPFNRNGNGIDEYEHQRPVFQALDDTYKKFN